MASNFPDILPLTQLPPKEFITKRLRLRAIQPGESKLIFDLYGSDPVATRYMSFKSAQTVEDISRYIEPAARYFQGMESPIRDFVWVIELRTGEPIGTVGFGPSNETTLGGGYILAPKWWGQGYASEAWSCIVDWAKKQPGVKRIEASHDMENPASGKVLQKAGMKLEKVDKSTYPNISESLRDSALYAWVR